MTIPTLTKITFTRCPDCKCSDIGGVRLGTGFGKHTCGEWREFITFRCGSEYEYSPNFSKIVIKNPCQKEGINEVTVDVTIRLTLKVRKSTDISSVDPCELFQVPGSDNYGCYQWQRRDKPEHLQSATVVRVALVKTSKIKSKG